MYTGLKIRLYHLLRASERYTKTDMIYLMRGGFWSGVSQTAYIPLAIGLSVAFANLVSPEVYGTYRFVLSLASIIGVFALTGVDLAIPQAVARGYEGMLRSGFATYMRWGWVTFAAAGVGALYYLLNGNTVLGYSLLIIGVCTPLFSGASLYGEYLSGRKEFRLAAMFSILQLVFTTAAVFTTILLSPDVLTLIAVYFVSHTLSALALYLYVSWRFRPNDATDPESERFGLHLSATNILGTVADQLDKVLVFHFFGAAQLAIYAFATAIPEYLRGSTKVFTTLAVPKYAIRDRASFDNTMIGKTIVLTLTLGLVVVAYMLAAPYIFELLYPRYLESIPYSQVYALVILAGAGSIPMATLLSQRAVREQYTQSVVNNLVRIGLLLVLSYVYGLWGIIFARVLSRLFGFSLGTMLAWKMAKDAE
jgi:O-antigen/teichoic acid export membrane protein